jgi:hypothetical protein
MGHMAHKHSVADESKLGGQPEGTDNACAKCCGMCVLTSVLPHDPSWVVAPMVSRISFAFISEQLRGRIVFVEPDIPKRIV